jgi:hypothetical protein
VPQTHHFATHTISSKFFCSYTLILMVWYAQLVVECSAIGKAMDTYPKENPDMEEPAHHSEHQSPSCLRPPPMQTGRSHLD